MNNHGKINYIELPAKDFSSTKNFYSNVFAWEFEDYGPDYMAFSNAGIDGGFFRSEQNSATVNGAALIVFYSIEIEATLEKIKIAGGKVVQNIFSFPSGRRFHFTDPNGNELAVWSDID